MIGYLDEGIRLIFLVLDKMDEYITTFKDKSNKLVSRFIDDDKLLDKHETIWTKIAYLRNVDQFIIRDV